MKPIEYIRQALYKGLVSYLVAPVSDAAVRRPRQDMQALLQPGDVILVAGKTRFASLVCRLTRSTWSHVAIYVGPGHHADPAHCIVEADVEAGVRMIRLADLADNDIQVVRASRLPEASRQELIDYLLARVGLAYDLSHVIELARLVLFAPSPLGRWLSPRTMRRPTRRARSARPWWPMRCSRQGCRWARVHRGSAAAARSHGTGSRSPRGAGLPGTGRCRTVAGVRVGVQLAGRLTLPAHQLRLYFGTTAETSS